MSFQLMVMDNGCTKGKDLAGVYKAGRPIIRKVLKIRIWLVPRLLGQYVATVAALQPGELPKFSSSKPSGRSDAPDCITV